MASSSVRSLFSRAAPKATKEAAKKVSSPPATQTRSLATTADVPTGAGFWDAVKARRTYYNLQNKSSVSDARLEEIVAEALKYGPSAFNIQSTRAVLVLGDKHKQVWDVIYDSHKPNMGDEAAQKAQKEKFDAVYRGGYATICFFEDTVTTDKFLETMPFLKGKFPLWTANTAGIAQYIVWAGLAAEGMGANLQHYSQFHDDNQAAINKFLGVPESWVGTAQMVVGVPSDRGAPGAPEFPKTWNPTSDKLKVVQ
ncbi:Fatty acid repression mutant protein 2 [Vanrija pseudolonga]|uniref:Fatty acid repression mutant protein 2 n=1 Tax=Vanrija pseudolonga TaxID=143232 RepID=A0AAF0YM45_9TREE|nr:Fatty acid repression mutant protein 2 [Vanrija pseudolonga]